MDITNLFAQVFGIYLVITGALVLIKQSHIVSIAKMFGKDQALRIAVGALVTLGGLFMVLAYHDWTTIETALITLVGWAVLIKGLLYLFASDSQINKMTNKFWGGHAYRMWGIGCLLAGLYLAYIGFGFH